MQHITAKVYTHITFSTKHHKTKTFQDEFMTFLKKYKVEYDGRYVRDWPACAPTGR